MKFMAEITQVTILAIEGESEQQVRDVILDKGPEFFGGEIENVKLRPLGADEGNAEVRVEGDDLVDLAEEGTNGEPSPMPELDDDDALDDEEPVA